MDQGVKAESTRWNVLVVPAGTEIGLEIGQALGGCKEVSLFAANIPCANHAPFAFRRVFEVPLASDESFIDRLNELLDAHQIDVVIPAHDDVVLKLAECAEEVRAKVIGSPLATAAIARSKSKTYDALAGIVATPRVFRETPKPEDFPVFVKPDIGQGSQGATIVAGLAELKTLQDRWADLLVMENLPGDEYTIDCFSCRKRGLIFCSGRRRIRTRAGISMTTERVENPRFLEIAQRIGDEFEFHGPWFFQLKTASCGELKLLEFAPRVAGTMAYQRAIGVNMPLMSLFEADGIEVSVAPVEAKVVLDRALINRYSHDLEFETVYVDLDDTLLFKGGVHPRLVGFLFQCLNRGKRLVLLTRHSGDLAETLSRHRLRELFDVIAHVPKDRCKSEFIDDQHGIFIDDSFSERQAVRLRRGIPTFDLSSLELLHDERV